jgi:hypothetical protein
MQRIILWIAAFVIIVAAPGCKKEMMSYEGVEGVYFAVQQKSTSIGKEADGPFFNFTNVEFAKFAGNEATVNVKVRITGPLKSYDRPFRVEINPDSTDGQLGVHYKALVSEVVIPANMEYAFVPVTLLRTADIATTVKRVGLRLVPNEYFKLSFPEWDAIPGRTYTDGPVPAEYDAGLHTLRVNDFIAKPAIWVGQLATDGTETGQWGVFTEKKIRLMMQLMNLAYTDFASVETMPLVLQFVLAAEMARYLIERNNAGDPVRETDGRLMYVSGVPWKSKPL